mgnify:CR=1 FL=1
MIYVIEDWKREKKSKSKICQMWPRLLLRNLWPIEMWDETKVEWIRLFAFVWPLYIWRQLNDEHPNVEEERQSIRKRRLVVKWKMNGKKYNHRYITKKRTNWLQVSMLHLDEQGRSFIHHNHYKSFFFINQTGSQLRFEWYTNHHLTDEILRYHLITVPSIVMKCKI